MVGNKQKIIFWGLIIIAIATRLSRVSQLGYFMIDEERDAFLVRRMLVDHKPLLVGGVIPGGINVGPLFFYFSAIPYFLSNLSPIGPAYAAGVIGIIGTIGVYLVGKKLFNNKVGLMAVIFSTFSILNIIYQRPWWPLTISQMVTTATYLSLFNLTNRGDKKWWWILMGALIIGAQSDPSTLSLIPLSAIWLWWNRKKIKINKKNVFGGIGLFLLAHLTWVIFEFRHNFLSIRAVVSLLGGEKIDGGFSIDGPIIVIRSLAGLLYRLFFITGLLDVTGQINPAEVFLSRRLSDVWWPGATSLLLVIGYWVVRSLKGENLARKIVSLHVLISLMGILIYTSLFPGYVHEWLWQFMFPAFFIIFADILVRLGRERMWMIWTALGIWGIWQMFLFTRLDNAAGLGNKLKIVKEMQANIANRSYELRSESELRYGGWRYLFTLYGKSPVKSYMDYVYEDWVYLKQNVKPEVVITITNSFDTSPKVRLDQLED